MTTSAPDCCRFTFHLLNGLNWWNVNLQQSGALVVIHTFDLEIVAQTRGAVDFTVAAALRVEEDGMVEVSLRRTGNQVHKILEISPVSHRQVLRLSGREVCLGPRP